MNIHLKTDKEIEIMKEGGRRLRKVVQALLKQIKTGISTKEIDKIAEKLILEEGGEPSFKKVKNYYWTTCLPINNQVVHTPPSNRILKEGDILTLDIGMFFQGYHTDFATTFLVGEKRNSDIVNFLEAGKITLDKAIKVAKVGKRIGHISQVIEKEIYGQGYFILKDLTGHGIGKNLHEDPYIFGYQERPIEKTMVIKPGLTIAIEVIYSQKTEKIAYEKEDDWSIVTADGSLSACFEHTIAITDKNTLVLT